MATNSAVKVNYLSRDFESIKQDLVNLARTRHADKLAFFNDASPDIMYMEMVAYVGDMLSYYTDKTFNESFLTTAQAREALIRITSNLGFFETGTTPSSVQVTLTINVPFFADPNTGVIKPNPDYLVNISPGMQLKADNGTPFEILEEVNFTDERNRVIIPNLDGNNAIIDYTISKTAVAKAGETKIQRFYVSPDLALPFLQINIDDSDVTEVMSAVDLPGSVFTAPTDSTFTDPDVAWFQVKYLTQDSQFLEINPLLQPQNNFTNLIDPVVVIGAQVDIPRRFIVRRDVNNLTSLIFGSSSPDFGAFNSLIQTNIDPNTISYNQVLNNAALGQIPPANSTLFIKYRSGGGESTNVVVGQINTIVSKTFGAAPSTANLTILQSVRNSLAVSNPIPALGGRAVPSNEELRASIGKSFASQERVVTYEDLRVSLGEMPPIFGKPFRISFEEIKPRVANFQQVENGINFYLNALLAEATQTGRQLQVQNITDFLDNLQNGDAIVDPTTNTLTTLSQETASLLGASPTLWIGEKARLYVIGIDENSQLVTTLKDQTTGLFTSPLQDLKLNIKEYLRQKRLIGDWVDIVDGRVVNVTVEFTILVDKKNPQQVLTEALNAMRNYFNINNWQMNQPIFIANVSTILQQINGVINVVDLKFYNIFNTDPISGRQYQPQEIGRYRNNSATSVNVFNNKFEMNTVNNVILQYNDSIFEVRFPDSDIIGSAIVAG